MHKKTSRQPWQLLRFPSIRVVSLNKNCILGTLNKSISKSIKNAQQNKGVLVE